MTFIMQDGPLQSAEGTVSTWQGENLSKISLIAFTQKRLRKENVINSLVVYPTKYSILISYNNIAWSLKVIFCRSFKALALCSRI